MTPRKPLSRPLTESDGFGHIESYLRSGLRPSEYYKSHGLSEWQFYTWRKRYFSAHPKGTLSASPGNQFHPVRIVSAPCGALSGLEIHYPHGVKVVISQEHSLDISQIAELIKLPL